MMVMVVTTTRKRTTKQHRKQKQNKIHSLHVIIFFFGWGHAICDNWAYTSL